MLAKDQVFKIDVDDLNINHPFRNMGKRPKKVVESVFQREFRAGYLFASSEPYVACTSAFRLSNEAKFIEIH
jgi:hypothetical protein